MINTKEKTAIVKVEQIDGRSTKYTYPNGAYAILWIEEEDDKVYSMVSLYNRDGELIKDSDFYKYIYCGDSTLTSETTVRKVMAI